MNSFEKAAVGTLHVKQVHSRTCRDCQHWQMIHGSDLNGQPVELDKITGACTVHPPQIVAVPEMTISGLSFSLQTYYPQPQPDFPACSLFKDKRPREAV